MSDQADALRRLLRTGPEATVPRARSLVFTSGKGGVGTSNLALNLAIALGELGRRVVLVDADLGLANIELLCGLSPTRDLGDVLAGEVTLDEAIVEGPAGVRLLAGAHGLRALAESLNDGPTRLASELAEQGFDADYVLIDAGSGLGPGVATIAEVADEVVVVTTPEPTSVADAHAALGRLKAGPGLRLVVTQADSNREAADCLARIRASSRQFHGIVATPLGHVRYDPRIRRAVRARRPILVEHTASRASRDIRRIARRLVEEDQPTRSRGIVARVAALYPLVHAFATGARRPGHAPAANEPARAGATPLVGPRRRGLRPIRPPTSATAASAGAEQGPGRSACPVGRAVERRDASDPNAG